MDPWGREWVSGCEWVGFWCGYGSVLFYRTHHWHLYPFAHQLQHQHQRQHFRHLLPLWCVNEECRILCISFARTCFVCFVLLVCSLVSSLTILQPRRQKKRVHSSVASVPEPAPAPPLASAPAPALISTYVYMCTHIFFTIVPLELLLIISS